MAHSSKPIEDKAGATAPSWLIIGAFLFGIVLSLPTAVPQSATTGSLAVAGIIQYLPNSLMAQFLFGFWSITHHIGAILLLLGVSEHGLNVLYCAMTGGLIVSSYAMIIFAFSQNVHVSIIAAMICYLTGFLIARLPSPDFGAYGHYLGAISNETYSMIGGAACVWVLGALAGGRYGLAGFSAAIAISIHPILGLFTVAVLCSTVLAFYMLSQRIPAWDILRGFALGLIIAAASFIAFRLMLPLNRDVADPEALSTYLRLWDSHRNRPLTPSVARIIAISSAVMILGLVLAFFVERTTLRALCSL